MLFSIANQANTREPEMDLAIILIGTLIVHRSNTVETFCECLGECYFDLRGARFRTYSSDPESPRSHVLRARE